MAVWAGARLAWEHSVDLGIRQQNDAADWIKDRQPKTSVWETVPGGGPSAASASTSMWLRPPPPPPPPGRPPDAATEPASSSKRRSVPLAAVPPAANQEYVWQVITGKNKKQKWSDCSEDLAAKLEFADLNKVDSFTHEANVSRNERHRTQVRTRASRPGGHGGRCGLRRAFFCESAGAAAGDMWRVFIASMQNQTVSSAHCCELPMFGFATSQMPHHVSWLFSGFESS